MMGSMKLLNLTGTIFLSVTLLSTMGCMNRQAKSKQKGDVRAAVNLGDGYDHLASEFLNQNCMVLEPNVQSVSDIPALQITKVDDVSELKAKLGYSVEGEFTYGLVSGDAKASMISESESSQRSISLFAHKKIISKVERAMNASPKNGYNPVTCGSKYVASLFRGAEIDILMKISFGSTKSKAKFDAEARGSYGNMGSVKASISSMSEEMKNSSEITIKIISRGENLHQLRPIFSGGDFVSCSMTEFSRCEKVMSDLIDYMEGDFKVAAATSNTVIDFNLSDVPNQNGSVPEELAQKREQLAKALIEFTKDIGRAGELEISQYLNRDEKARYSGMKEIIMGNADLTRKALLDCFKNYVNCNTNIPLNSYDKDALKPRLVHYDEGVSAETTGVVDCLEKLTGIVKGKCEKIFEKHESHATGFEAIGVRGFSEEGRDLLNRRRCKAETSRDAICRLSIEI